MEKLFEKGKMELVVRWKASRISIWVWNFSGKRIVLLEYEKMLFVFLRLMAFLPRCSFFELGSSGKKDLCSLQLQFGRSVGDQFSAIVL